MHGSVLAKFRILWKWENLLLKEFLNWSLKVLLVNIAIKHLCWWWQYPSPREFSTAKRDVKKQPGHTWIETNSEVPRLW
jgi:hypothetical protein